MPPATAPGIEPKPPRTAAVKPLMTIRPILEDRKTTGATSTPATPPPAAPTPEAARPPSRRAPAAARAPSSRPPGPAPRPPPPTKKKQRGAPNAPPPPADDPERHGCEPHRPDRDRARAEERRKREL